MLRALFVMALLTLTNVAYAQHKHSHDGEKGPNGGLMADAGDYHVELLVRDGIIDVHVLDHDNKPLHTKGYKGVAIVSIDGKSQRIVLDPAGESRLTGKAGGALPPKVKGVVQITPPSGKALQARFN